MRPSRLTFATAALAGLLTLTGCAASSDSSSSEAVPPAEAVGVEAGAAEVASTVSAGKGAYAPGQNADGPVAQPAQVIRTANVTVRVDDVSAALVKVRAMTRAAQGQVATEDTYADGQDITSTLTVRIPSAGMDAFLEGVGRLGDVDGQSVAAQDVTTQAVDLDARIAALDVSVDRMTQLLAQATRIEDMLAIEQQLSARQAELDSLTAQRDALADQVALSTVTVVLTPVSAPVQVQAPGFVGGLQSGMSALGAAAAIAVSVAGFALPFVAVALLAAAPVVMLVRRRRRRHTAAPGEPVVQQASAIN